jgi:hypothetical protein
MASDGELVKIDAEGVTLPRLIDRASKALLAARSSAEVLEAGRLADVAYSASKMAGRMAKQTKAHDKVIAACHRAQADALEIEAGAKRRLADEYDAAQERGEVRKQADNQAYSKTEKAGASDTGLTAKQIHDARAVRDAERDDPGIVKRTLDDLVTAGKEPTKAALRKATRKASTKRREDNSSKRRGHPRHSEPDDDETGDSDADRWERSLGNIAGTAIAMPAFWTKQFGKEWKDFEVSLTAETLAKEAAQVWTQLAADLTKRRERKTCVSLYLKLTDAEQERAQWLVDHPNYSAPVVAVGSDAI